MILSSTRTLPGAKKANPGARILVMDFGPSPEPTASNCMDNVPTMAVDRLAAALLPSLPSAMAANGGRNARELSGITTTTTNGLRSSTADIYLHG